MSQFLFWNLLAKKLSGEASPEELEQLEMLIRQHPGLAYEAERIQKLWQFKKDTDQQESELAFEEHVLRMNEAGIPLPDPEIPETYQTNHNNRRRIFNLFIAATLIFLIVGFVWLTGHKKEFPLLSENNFREVSSPPGSKTKLILPDSTVVWLNAGSKLTYNEHFGVTNRNTILVGEAFFDVKKSTIPFTIRANTIQIKVLGTAFNVKAYPGDKTTETTLIRGRVEVTLDKRPGEPIILRPNEKLIVASQREKIQKDIQKEEPLVVWKGLTRTPDSTIIETSWVHNELIFQDEAFNEIALKMERWYGVTIEFKDEQIAKERLSGTFTTETIQDALNALQQTTKFHYVIKGHLITITQ